MSNHFRVIRENAYRDVWLLVISAIMIWSAVQTYHTAAVANRTAKQTRAESRDRRNQTCVVFERMHQIDVVQLASTYQFVANLSQQQTRGNLNQAIIRQLPITEKRARRSKPPRYCTRPGVGLDDRKLEAEPKRPPEVERLLSGR